MEQKLITLDTAANLAEYSVVEANVTVLCAALIACKPVVMVILPDSFIATVGSFLTRSFSSLRSSPRLTKTTPEVEGQSIRKTYCRMLH